MTETVRCRLFKVPIAGSDYGGFMYTEVWDRPGDLNPEDDLPNGEVVFESSDQDFAAVRATVDHYRGQNSISAGAWRNRGSI